MGAERRAWIEIDLKALEENVRFLRSRLPAGCRLMAAVKADAYGHGAPVIAGELQRLGLRAFCVATAEEGAALRQSGIRGEVLVLGYTGRESLALAAENDLLLTAADLEHARLLSSAGLRLRIHLAVDTGMRRLGEPAEALDRLEAAFHLKNLRTEGLFTHLCTEDGDFCREQAGRFRQTVDQLRRRGCAFEKAHLLSSASLLRFPELGGDYARTGLALYGYGAPELKPVLSLKTRVAAVKTLKKGEGAGYGLRFRARRETRLAVLSIGYADGLPRQLSCGKGSVLLRGRAAPIAGLLCMDQALVDVTDIPQVRPGDEAVLIGRSGELRQSAEDLARAAGTIPNEILSRLGSRPERIVL